MTASRPARASFGQATRATTALMTARLKLVEENLTSALLSAKRGVEALHSAGSQAMGHPSTIRHLQCQTDERAHHRAAAVQRLSSTAPRASVLPPSSPCLSDTPCCALQSRGPGCAGRGFSPRPATARPLRRRLLRRILRRQPLLRRRPPCLAPEIGVVRSKPGVAAPWR